jgi:hypothetical protein
MSKMPLTARRVESSGAAGPLLVNPGPVLEWSIRMNVCILTWPMDDVERQTKEQSRFPLFRNWGKKYWNLGADDAEQVQMGENIDHAMMAWKEGKKGSESAGTDNKTLGTKLWLVKTDVAAYRSTNWVQLLFRVRYLGIVT